MANSLSASLEYRANFFMAVLVECAYLFVKILYVIVSYQTDLNINGLTPDSILLFVGTFVFITGIMSMVYFPNFLRIPGYVHDGSLDLFITKPVSSQFMVSFRYVDFGWALPNVVGGIIMIIIALCRLNITPTWWQFAGFAFYNFTGIVLTYSLLLLPEILAFYFIKLDWLQEVIYALWDFNNMPMNIYGRTIRGIGTFAIPFFVITNYPPLFLLNKLKIYEIIWGIVLPVVGLIIVKYAWKKGISKYESASS